MKVSLFGKNSDSIRHLIPEYGLELTDDQPEVMISYGGDGTLLSMERKYPGIPKLPIRDSKVCKKCPLHTTEHLLKELAEGKINKFAADAIKLKNYPKLEAKFETAHVLALNDFVIRNSIPIHALRFRVYINGQLVQPGLIIGDGVVLTTTFGSTGYYKSITRQTIEKDFAIAFNNTTEVIEPVKFSKGDEIRIVIIRGPGTLSSDNNPRFLYLREGAEVKIFPSSYNAQIYVEKTLRCTDCIVLRDKRLR